VEVSRKPFFIFASLVSRGYSVWCDFSRIASAMSTGVKMVLSSVFRFSLVSIAYSFTCGVLQMSLDETSL